MKVALSTKRVWSEKARDFVYQIVWQDLGPSKAGESEVNIVPHAQGSPDGSKRF